VGYIKVTTQILISWSYPLFWFFYIKMQQKQIHFLKHCIFYIKETRQIKSKKSKLTVISHRQKWSDTC